GRRPSQDRNDPTRARRAAVTTRRWTSTPLSRSPGPASTRLGTIRRPSETRRRWTGHSDKVNDGTTSRRATHQDGLWSPGRRALTLGLVLNVTIVASEALAVGTILPIVAKDLGGIDLYGWVFAGFFLGNLLGIVVAGMLIDR